MDQQKSSVECYERGLVLKRIGMLQEAIENFQHAALNPEYAGRAHVHIALCLKAVGNQEEAVVAFRKAFTSPSLSSEERRHILYHIGQTLESLGRYAESLEAYSKLRNEDPEFRDVTQKIKRLCNSGRRSLSESETSWQVWMDEARTLTPTVLALLEQTGLWLGRQAETLKSHRWFESANAAPSNKTGQGLYAIAMSKRRSQSVGRDRMANTRRHARVPVRLRSQFTTDGLTVGGEGELRDLSPWGCRMTSPATVSISIGADMKCRIFPKGAGSPFVIDGATVRWISREEFGLAFTKVHPGVQQQLEQLCSAQAA
ncbi:MAG: tetratricopeptide repeat protein [Nitrospira sp.]|nr:tetratricopeptide repeat protein [Nitrospira sp.]MBH0196768.1 tetratricopeptide repeat protein [Nitrospira sp.]